MTAGSRPDAAAPEAGALDVSEFAAPEASAALSVRPDQAPRQPFHALFDALAEAIEREPGRNDVLAVLRRLEAETAPAADAERPPLPRIGRSRRRAEDIVRFGQDPSMDFPSLTIDRIARDGQDGALLLYVRFLGLLGPQGALPVSLTEEAYTRARQGDDALARCFDVFNNRFIQLFYRAWSDARPIAQHDRPREDRFQDYISSAIGLGSPIYRDQDGVDDRVKAFYAGLMAPKAKSAARLEALISGVFGIRTEIEQCVGAWLRLDPEDQLAIGRDGPSGGRLGINTMVGARVYSVSDKIRIRLYARDLEEYRRFLPSTRVKRNFWTEKLFDLIDFYLGLETEYEIELALPKRCAAPVTMNRTASATLGHIGWLMPRPGTDGDRTSVAAVEDEDEPMLRDTRFRPTRAHTALKN